MFSGKYYRHFFKLALFVIVALHLSGCETFGWLKEEEEDEPRKVVAFYARADAGRTDAMNIEVEARVDGKPYTLQLQKIPLMTSERITKIKALPNGRGGYLLKMYLDIHSKIRWQGDSVKYHGMPVVVMVDNKPVSWWQVQSMPSAQDYIIVDCNLKKELAEEIAAASENNYKKLSQREWLDFIKKDE